MAHAVTFLMNKAVPYEFASSIVQRWAAYASDNSKAGTWEKWKMNKYNWGDAKHYFCFKGAPTGRKRRLQGANNFFS